MAGAMRGDEPRRFSPLILPGHLARGGAATITAVPNHRRILPVTDIADRIARSIATEISANPAQVAA